MKKTLAILLVAILALTLFACTEKKEKQPAEKPNAIVGTWEGSGDRFTFNSDGTGTWAEGRNEDGTFGAGAPIRYTIDGNVLTIGEDETFTFSVDGDTLILNDFTFTRK
jgi:hypothetical protein